jgi:TolB-like protein/DNA-binding winged helix-turn-helix (wHTH) protein/Flp pilus assembly protein TadD
MGVPVNNNDRPNTGYQFGDYRLDTSEGLLQKDGREVPLTPTLLEILLTLVHYQGRILDKQRFMNSVWPGRVVEEGNLARNISTLRRILDDDPQHPRYIETVPRRGYRFIADVRTSSDSEHASIAGTAPAKLLAHGGARGASSLREPRREPMRRRIAALLAVGVLAPAVLLVAAVSHQTDSVSPSAGDPIRSLVVLPLADLSDNSREEYFADGMTEALISDLGKIETLTVSSRTSAMHYKGTAKRLPQIARELDVQAVVEGSVMRSGGKVRITVRLVDAASDRGLWTETYERDAGDVLSLTSGLARIIARRIEIAVTPEENLRLAATRPVDEKAHEAYLRGLFFKNKGSVDSLHKAIAHFEQAVTIEPDFALAYAAMADTYLVLASWQGPSRILWPKAREAATRALEIDATVARAYLVLAGALLCHDLDQSAAEPVFLRALELNPGDALARARYAYSLMTQGRFDESLAEARRSIELDPVSLAYNMMLGQVLHFSGRNEEARRQLLSALELDARYPEAHRVLGLVHLQMGMPEQAALALEEALALGGGGGVVGELGYVYGVMGRKEDALRQMAILEELSREGRDAAFSLALVHYGLGELDATFEWLQKAHDERDFRMIRLVVDPVWDGLRQDPRFRQLLLRIGLEPNVQA